MNWVLHQLQLVVLKQIVVAGSQTSGIRCVKSDILATQRHILAHLLRNLDQFGTVNELEVVKHAILLVAPVVELRLGVRMWLSVLELHRIHLC